MTDEQKPVDWKALFEAAHGALICIAEAQADALYARQVADALTSAALATPSPAPAPVDDAGLVARLSEVPLCTMSQRVLFNEAASALTAAAKREAALVRERDDARAWHEYFVIEADNQKHRAIAAEKALTEAHDHIAHADAYQQTAMNNLERAIAAEARVAALWAVLKKVLYHSKDGRWVIGMNIDEDVTDLVAALETKETT